MKPSNIFFIALFVLAVLFLWNWKCNPKETVVRIVTVYKKSRDTVFVEKPNLVKEVRVEVPVRVPVYITRVEEGRTRVDTFWKPLDTSETVRDYFTLRSYSDTGRVEYGLVVANYEVFRNRSQNFQLITDLKIPEITKTVEIKRSRFLIGGDIYGDPGPTGAGVNIGFQNKKGRVVSLGVLKLDKYPTQYRAGFFIPVFSK